MAGSHEKGDDVAALRDNQRAGGGSFVGFVLLLLVVLMAPLLIARVKDCTVTA